MLSQPSIFLPKSHCQTAESRPLRAVSRATGPRPGSTMVSTEHQACLGQASIVPVIPPVVRTQPVASGSQGYPSPSRYTHRQSSNQPPVQLALDLPACPDVSRYPCMASFHRSPMMQGSARKAESSTPRKSCNCKNSRCLKL